MSFMLRALSEKPLGLWMMDDTTPLQDYSGYNATATTTGTVTTHASTVANAAYASAFTNTVTASYASPIFRAGKEDIPFTISAWVRVISTDGTYGSQQVLGHSGQMDGLLINGTVASFVVKFSDGSNVTASYDMQIPQRAALYGTYNREKITLWVNGQAVSQTELSTAQKALAFNVDADLVTGASTSTQKIAVNAVAIYSHALNSDAIAVQYEFGTRQADIGAAASGFDGIRVPLSVNEADLFLNEVFESNEDWLQGQLTNVTVENNNLSPGVANDLSVAGNWIAALPLDALGYTSVFGVNMWWDGVGAIVEASLDGTTWVAVTRGVNISNIASGFNPTGQTLLIRVSFAGGVVDDQSYLDNLVVYGFRTGAASVVDNRTVTISGAGYFQRDVKPADLRDDWGTLLTGGTLTIGADTGTNPITPKTVEVWIKNTNTTAPTLSTNLTTGSTQYVNGAAGSTSLRGEWVVRHFVNSAGITGAVTVAGNAEIGHVVFYDTALTATQIKAIYDSYVGVRSTRFDDASSITATEVATATNIYAHDWSITGAG